MQLKEDRRIVMTLDAGGTNLVFSALRGGEEIIAPIQMRAEGHDLQKCLGNIVEGFSQVKQLVAEPVAAISFAFPGPADYKAGIIGDLQNLPGFRGGIALGALLEEKFGVPVFINNDGDLYAYGEAIGGMLPYINAKLAQENNPKRYHNLIGLTLGTGFGAGITRQGQMYVGDNCLAAEVWCTSNSIVPSVNMEEGVSTRAILREYFKVSGSKHYQKDLMPADVYDIAIGNKEGHQDAALASFHSFGTFLGDAIANLIGLLDGIVVIGGGLTGASRLYLPSVMEQLQGSLKTFDGGYNKRLVQEVYNLDNEVDEKSFYESRSKTIAVPGSVKKVEYDPIPRIGIATSQIGASKAINLGAYAFAVSQLK